MPAERSMFESLPVVLRFLRLEWGQTEGDLDRLLELPRGAYRRCERGEAQPSLAMLSAILQHFNVGLDDLDRRMRALSSVVWPSPTYRQLLREPLPNRKELARAAEVIRDLEYSQLIASDRLRPAEHGFETPAEAICWLRGVLRLTEAELAALTGEDEATIGAIEAGKRPPTEDERMRIARFVQRRFNNLLAAAGARGVPPCWDPPPR